VSVRLTADNLLAAGARFELKNAQNQIVETWDMQTGEDGVDEHTLSTAPPRLRDCFLQWRIRTCSMHPGNDQGTVSVTVGQDGVNRPIVPPAVYDLSNVPACKSGNASQIDDSFDWVVS
jgi:hypothetical protein